MASKKAEAGRKYEVDGKRFTWHPLDEDGKPTLDPVVIPLRLKLGAIRKLAGRDLDAAAMFDLLEAVIPDQADALDEMDLNDFQAMFTTWQQEYAALNGATPGESQP